MKCSLGISNFLVEIFSHSIVFLYLYCSLRKALLSFLAILRNSGGYIFPFLLCLASLLFPVICKASSDNRFAVCISFLGDGFDHHHCTVLWDSVHSSSGTLSDLIPWICHFHCVIARDLTEVIPDCSSDFPYFNLSLNFAIISSWSEPQSTPSLVFADCVELLHLWLQRI